MTSDVLDKLGFSEYHDMDGDAGSRNLRFTNGDCLTIIDYDSIDDANYGYISPPIYRAQHFGYNHKEDVFFLDELYEIVKTDFPASLPEFEDKIKAVYMWPYIDNASYFTNIR